MMRGSLSIIGLTLRRALQAWDQGDVASAQEENARAGALMQLYQDLLDTQAKDPLSRLENVVMQAESPMPPDDWEALWRRLASQPPVVIEIPDMTPNDWDRVRLLLFTRPAPTTPPAESLPAESASTTAPDPGALPHKHDGNIPKDASAEGADPRFVSRKAQDVRLDDDDPKGDALFRHTRTIKCRHAITPFRSSIVAHERRFLGGLSDRASSFKNKEPETPAEGGLING